METFSALLVICAGNSPVPVTRNFDICVDLRLNKRLSKQSWGWWFETLSRPLWRHSNAIGNRTHYNDVIMSEMTSQITSLKLLFRCKWKKTSTLRVTGLCDGNSPVNSEFPEQRASNVENVSIWWRHHDVAYLILLITCLQIPSRFK